MITYEEAERLAAAAHGRSKMLSGRLLIDHARRVASHFDPVGDVETAVAAVLHDTVEKGPLELDDLRRAGVEEHLVAVVDALTERADETEQAYLSRCVVLPMALRIKRVDLADKIALHLDGDVDAEAAAQMQRNAGRRLLLLEDLARRTPEHPPDD